MRQHDPIQFVFKHDDTPEAIARGRELVNYARVLVARTESTMTTGATFNAMSHTLPDGSEVRVQVLGAKGGRSATQNVRQYVAEIITKSGGPPPSATYPYLWAGARWMYEVTPGAHPFEIYTDAPSSPYPLEMNLGMEVFEPAQDDPDKEQLHVSSWNFMEFWFPWRNESQEFRTNFHNDNPGMWGWDPLFYSGTKWAGHAANARAPGRIAEMSYTDRFMYQVNWAFPPDSYSGDGIRVWGAGSLAYVPSAGDSLLPRWNYPQPPAFGGDEGVTWAPYDPTDPNMLEPAYPWSVVTVLDPYEGMGQLPSGAPNRPTDTRKHRAWKNFLAEHAIHGVTSYGPPQVVPGSYYIKVFGYGDICAEWVIPPIELKVIVGKSPNMTIAKYQIQLDRLDEGATVGFAYGWNLCWNNGSCCPRDDALNIQAPNYWQDAAVANPMGAVSLASDTDAPAWPPMKIPAFAAQPADEPTGARCNYAARTLVIVAHQPFAAGWVGRDQDSALPGPQLEPDDGLPQAVGKIVQIYHQEIFGAVSLAGQGVRTWGPCEFVGPAWDCIIDRRAIEELFRAVNPTNGAIAVEWDPFEGRFTVIPETLDVLADNRDFACMSDPEQTYCKTWPDWMNPWVCNAYANPDAEVISWFSFGQDASINTEAWSGINECGQKAHLWDPPC